MEELKVTGVDDVLRELDDVHTKGTATNNYLLFDDYKRLVGTSAIRLFKETNNLYLLERKGVFYRMYYHLNDFEIKTSLGSIESSIVTEVLYRKNRLPIAEKEFWNNCGFKDHLSREHFFLNVKDVNISFESIHESVEIVKSNDEQELKFAKQLIDKYLDLYTGDNLTLNELKKYSDKGDLFIAYFEGKMAGVLQGELKKGVYWLGHVVIHENYRGKGLGRFLTNYYLQQGINKNVRQFQLWVLTDNFAANRLYESYGFKSMNRFTQSLLKD